MTRIIHIPKYLKEAALAFKQSLDDFEARRISKGLHFELLHGSQQNIYTIRGNDEVRLVLTPIYPEGRKEWVLIDILNHHQYDSLKRKNPAYELERALANLDTELPLETENVVFKETDALVWHGDGVIWLDRIQETAIARALPLILSGPPGSGKSSTAEAILTQWGEKHRADLVMPTPDNPKPIQPRLLYVTNSTKLVKEMESNWLAAREHNPLLQGYEVDFRTPIALIREQLKGRPEATWAEVGEADFCTWFEAQVKRQHQVAKSQGVREESPSWHKHPQRVYQEFRAMSGYINEEEYKNQVQSLFDDNTRPVLWGLYQQYGAYLTREKQIDPSFFPLHHEHYKMVVVDEAQDLSRSQLKTLIRDKQIVFCVGDHQQLRHPEFAIPYLKSLFRGDGSVDPNQMHIALQASYRCPELVVKMANRILEFKAHATERHKTEFRDICARRDMGLGQLHWYEKEEQIKRFKQEDAYADLVVLASEKHYAKAVEEFGEARVFTVNQFKGLQAPKVLLYMPLDDQIYDDVDRVMADFESLDPSAHQKSLVHSIAFNRLFVGLTRTQNSLFIYQPPLDKDRVRHLRGLFKESVVSTGIEDIAPPAVLSLVEQLRHWNSRLEGIEHDPELAIKYENIRKKIASLQAELDMRAEEKEAEDAKERLLVVPKAKAPAPVALAPSSSKKSAPVKKKKDGSNKKKAVVPVDIPAAENVKALAPSQLMSRVVQVKTDVEALNALLLHPKAEACFFSIPTQTQGRKNLFEYFVANNKTKILIAALFNALKEISPDNLLPFLQLLCHESNLSDKSSLLALVYSRGKETTKFLEMLSSKIAKMTSLEKFSFDNNSAKFLAYAAFQDNSMDMLNILHQLKFDFNKHTYSGGSRLLHFAVRLKKHVDLLLAYGADPYLTDNEGNSPITLLDETTDLETTIKFNKFINFNLSGESIAHLAAKSGSVKVLEWIYQQEFGPALLVQENEIGETPALIAAYKGHKEFILRIQELINLDVENISTSGRSILHAAIAGSQLAFIQWAITRFGTSLLDKTDNYGQKPVHAAAIADEVDILAFLKAKGVDFNDPSIAVAAASGEKGTAITWLYGQFGLTFFQRVDENGFLPCMMAAFKGNIKALESLKSIGIDFTQLLQSGKTIAHFAVHNNTQKRVTTITWLYNNFGLGILQQPDVDGYTPLFAAVYVGAVDVIEQLANLGVDLHACFKDKVTIAHVAAREGMIDVLHYIATKVDLQLLTAPNEFGLPPAIYAILNSHLNVLNTLLEYGVDFQKIVTREGQNCVHYAATRGQVLKWLIDKIDLSLFSQPNKNGFSPIDFTILKDALDCLEYFISKGIHPRTLTLPVSSWKLFIKVSPRKELIESFESYLQEKDITSDETILCISPVELAHILKAEKIAAFLNRAPAPVVGSVSQFSIFPQGTGGQASALESSSCLGPE